MNRIINFKFSLFCFLLIALFLTVGNQSLAEEITATIMLDHKTSSLLVNPQTNKFYSISEILGGLDTDGSVHSVIDGETNTVTSTFSIPTQGLASLNPQTNKLYLAYQKKVQVVDLSNNTLVTSINLEDTALHIKVNPITNKIYVTTFNTNNVYVIDGSTNTIIKTITFGSNLNKDKLIDFNDISNTLYIAFSKDNQIQVIDSATHTQLRTYLLGNQQGESIISLAFNKATNKLYYSTTSDKLYFIDTTSERTNTTGATTSFVVSGLSDYLTDITVDSGSNKIYAIPCSNRRTLSSNTVLIIDGANNNILQRLDLPSNPYKREIVVNSQTKTIYVASSSPVVTENQITVIKNDGMSPSSPSSSSSGSLVLPGGGTSTSSSGSPDSPSMSSNIGAAEIGEAYSILEELIDTSKDLGKAVARARQNTAKIIGLAKRIEYALDAQPSNCSESIGSLSSELQDAVSDLYSINNEGIKDSGIESLVDNLKGVLETDSTSNNTIDVCKYNSPYSSFNPSASVTDQASTKLEELISTSRDLRGIRQARSIVGRIIALANKITHALSGQQSNCSESISSLLLQLNDAASGLSLINHEGVRDANIGAIMYDLNKILGADLDNSRIIDVCEAN